MKLKKIEDTWVLLGYDKDILDSFDTKAEAYEGMTKYGRDELIHDVDNHAQWENLHKTEVSA